MTTQELLNNVLYGSDTKLSEKMKDNVSASIANTTKMFDDLKIYKSSNDIVGGNNKSKVPSANKTESFYTSISSMINGDNRLTGVDFSGMLDNIYQKNKKYFSIIKDYEIMPILIPQINRVLMFLVNECISPDIQNNSTFKMRYNGDTGSTNIQDNINDIKDDMDLDKILKRVYTNRYKLGREYYLVVDYNKTFDTMATILDNKTLNESTCDMSDSDFLTRTLSKFSDTINEVSINECIEVSDSIGRVDFKTLNFDIKNLNIVIERGSLCEQIENARSEVITESVSAYSNENMYDMLSRSDIMNEDAKPDTANLSSIIDSLRRKKIKRCVIQRLDPARVFKLKVGGRVVGYFYTTDLNDTNATKSMNLSQNLKDRLLKSKANNISGTYANIEKTITKAVSEKIINTFDPNIGINRIEDIDLLHDYVYNNEIFKGDKKVLFYYSDDVFDLSREDDSILTNAVFFTKMYATLILNNITTKILRGRGRQIHTVNMGVSAATRRYIENAMASLTMPETNLGSIHGSFEQLLNPLNSGSDIVIPTEDGADSFIKTDYIEGQNISMDEEFLKLLLNSIITSFGLDAAVLDATNGNVQFAKTLTMESLQISNAVLTEQGDLIKQWKALCLKVLSIMGDDATIAAVTNGQVEVSFFSPKSLIIQNSIDDINNSKSYAEAIADVMPEFASDDENNRVAREKFVYNIIKNNANVDWDVIESSLKSAKVEGVGTALKTDTMKTITDMLANTVEKTTDDITEEDLAEDEI